MARNLCEEIVNHILISPVYVPANIIPSCPLLPTLAPVLTEISLGRTDIERTMSKTSEREAETGRGGPVK